MMIMGQSFVQALTLWSDTLTVTVTATVPSDAPPEEPETIIIFKGLAYPGSDVIIRQDGTLLATVPAGPNARFDVSIDIDPGIYTFSIFGEDTEGRSGRITNFTLSLTEGTTTTISGIFLSPTIDIDKNTVALGDSVTIFGITVPQSEVTVLISSPWEVASKITSEGDGTWTDSFLGVDLEVGSHSARARTTSGEGFISDYSETLSFVVTDAEELDPCAMSDPGDINCDGFVDLVDFSILLYYWNQTDPANARADINSDGTVNITDFSIMLYHWTG